MSTTPNSGPAHDDMIWRRELQRRLDVSSETMRRWLKQGRLPKPDVYVTQKTMGWNRATLRAAGIAGI